MEISAISPRYPIPSEERRVELRISNSRFIATAAYTPSVDAARAFIACIRSEFADATHNVFAYVIGHGLTVTAGMSDDGEPSGTAGRPALAVLRGSGLGDTCVVITRYFGGTLLGTGGLVRAYADATRAVLADLPRAEKVERTALELVVPYALYQPVSLLIESHGATIEEQTFAVDVVLRVSVDADRAASFVAELIERTHAQVVVRHEVGL